MPFRFQKWLWNKTQAPFFIFMAERLTRCTWGHPIVFCYIPFHTHRHTHSFTFLIFSEKRKKTKTCPSRSRRRRSPSLVETLITPPPPSGGGFTTVFRYSSDVSSVSFTVSWSAPERHLVRMPRTACYRRMQHYPLHHHRRIPPWSMN